MIFFTYSYAKLTYLVKISLTYVVSDQPSAKSCMNFFLWLNAHTRNLAITSIEDVSALKINE